jgi:hypothetical protein
MTERLDAKLRQVLRALDGCPIGATVPALTHINKCDGAAILRAVESGLAKAKVEHPNGIEVVRLFITEAGREKI